MVLCSMLGMVTSIACPFFTSSVIVDGRFGEDMVGRQGHQDAASQLRLCEFGVFKPEYTAPDVPCGLLCRQRGRLCLPSQHPSGRCQNDSSAAPIEFHVRRRLRGPHRCDACAYVARTSLAVRRTGTVHGRSLGLPEAILLCLTNHPYVRCQSVPCPRCSSVHAMIVDDVDVKNWDEWLVLTDIYSAQYVLLSII